VNYRRIAKILGFIVLVGVVALFIIQAFPSLVGADYSFIVQSASMEPAISTGSIVFVEEVPPGQVDERVEEGDVITYSESGGLQATTTHRVVEKRTGEVSDSLSLITKGDANENVDPEPVYRDQVVGVVMFSVPFIGRVVALAGTRFGWFLLVVVPVTLLLMDGLWQIYLAFEPEDNGE